MGRVGTTPRREAELPIDFRYQCLLLANMNAADDVPETIVERAAKYFTFVTNGPEEQRQWRLEVLKMAIKNINEDAVTVIRRAKVYGKFLATGATS